MEEGKRMKSNYVDLHQEIYRLLGMRERSEVDGARDCYDQYVNLIILEVDISQLEKDSLSDLWEDKKC